MKAGAVRFYSAPRGCSCFAVPSQNPAAGGRAGSPREPFRLGDLVIDYAQHRATVGGRALVLTETESRLLYELSVNPGRVLSRDYLMSRVWADREDGPPQVVRAYVRRLRRKLGESAENPRYIFSEPRSGYWLGEPAEVAGGNVP